MSRKFSIVATVDLSRIDEEITKYVNLNGNFDPYIFMNEDTANAIANEVGAHDIVVGGVDLPNKKIQKIVCMLHTLDTRCLSITI